LVAGDDDAWVAFWQDCAPDLLRFCRKLLHGVDASHIEDVRDEAVAIVFENVARGRVHAEPRRYAFGVVRKLCLKRARGRQTVSPSYLVVASALGPSRLLGTHEEVKKARRMLQKLFERVLRDVLDEAGRSVRRGLPSAPLLQWAVIDHAICGRASGPTLPDLLESEKSRVSKLRGAAISRLESAASSLNSETEGCEVDMKAVLALDEVADIWRSQLVGCPRFLPSRDAVHESHRGDLRLWEQVHSMAVECPVCSGRAAVGNVESVGLGKSYGEAAARRSRI
jgi:DNA-directed RNA polymerase specialized sigma24 family protein